MRYFIKLITLFLLLFFTGCSSLSSPQKNSPLTQDTDTHITSLFYESLFDTHQTNEAMLTLFFTKMPKGGDIHHHYAGTLYAETFLQWVKDKNWFIDSCSLRIAKDKKDAKCELLSVDQLMGDTTLYRKLLTLWSDKDFYNHSHNQPPPDVNFFNTFGYFLPVADEYLDVGLAIIKERAIQENVSYIETMLRHVGIQSSDYFKSDSSQDINTALRNATSQKEVDSILDKISTTFLKSASFNTDIKSFTTMVADYHKGIDNADFIMRYQTYAVRIFEPLQVYTDLFSGYLAAKASPLIVGVNIVAPENSTVALKDYTLHMRMYNYLYKRYPKVNRALHAGELTLGMVRPENLIFHIRQARDIAHAQRIGHGIGLPYEHEPIKLLQDLKDHAAIEINFSSNEFILGVKGNQHPYLIYSRYGVPIVISTDDSGVSRNNLSHEYMLLASRYHPSYKSIKSYVYNSIEYSFLSPIDKLSARKLLDSKFLIFEREMKDFYQ